MPENVQAVKYIGVADTRIISEEDWIRTGVKGQPTTQWDKSNGFTVLAKYLRPDAIKYLRNDDDGFVVLLEDEGS